MSMSTSQESYYVKSVHVTSNIDGYKEGRRSFVCRGRGGRINKGERRKTESRGDKGSALFKRVKRKVVLGNHHHVVRKVFHG